MVDEMPLALWAYRTTYKSIVVHIPFTSTYGLEAVVLIELEVPSHRLIHYNPMKNEELLLKSRDMTNEKHDKAELRAAAY